MELHISLAAEKIASFGGIVITNSMLTTWLVIGLLLLVSVLGTRNIKLVPTGNLQQILELIVDGLYSLVESIAGHKAKTFFPLIFTFFVYILLSNWSGLIPGVGTIGFFHESTDAIEHAPSVAVQDADIMPLTEGSSTENHNAADEQLAADVIAQEVHKEVQDEHADAEEHHAPFTPLFRAPSADLNFTLALALISVFMIQYYGFKYLGFGGHLSKYFNFSNPILFFVGILELVGEFAKLVSFAFRLFGNVFAGEVLLAVMAFLIPYYFNIAPTPFFLLEIFVGFVQSLVFAILTLVFMTAASSSHEH